MARIGLCSDLKAPLRTTSQSGYSHQSAHLALPTAVTFGFEFGRDFGAAIDLLALSVDASNDSRQLSIRLGSLTLRPDPPSVVATARDPKYPTHQFYRILTAASMDTTVSQLDSLAKNTAASFKKSRSCLSLTTSRLSFVTSASRLCP